MFEDAVVNYRIVILYPWLLKNYFEELAENHRHFLSLRTHRHTLPENGYSLHQLGPRYKGQRLAEPIPPSDQSSLYSLTTIS